MAVGDNAKILKERTHSLPEVNFSDEGPLRHLHLGTERIQGSMHDGCAHRFVGFVAIVESGRKELRR
jgi:hypothetical protein